MRWPFETSHPRLCEGKSWRKKSVQTSIHDIPAEMSVFSCKYILHNMFGFPNGPSYLRKVMDANLFCGWLGILN